MTLICLWVGLVAVRYHAEHAAANSIEQLGGAIGWEGPSPAWLTRFLGHDPFAHVKSVGFTDVQVRDDDMQMVKPLYALQHIDIAQNHTFTGAGLQYLAGLQELRRVYLYNVPVTDEGLKSLPNLPKLEEVYVLATRITDAGIGHLAQFHAVKEIQLGSDQLSKEAVAALGKKLPNANVEWSGQGCDY